MTPIETLNRTQRLGEEPLLSIYAETATEDQFVQERRKLSITVNESLIRILTSMQQEITWLNNEIRSLSERLEKQSNLVEDNDIRTYILKHALDDKDWVEPDELFDIKTG